MVKFKDPSSQIVRLGETITQANLTEEKYKELIAVNPNYEHLFEKVVEQPVTKKAKDKE